MATSNEIASQNAQQAYQQALGRYNNLIYRQNQLEGSWAQYEMRRRLEDERKQAQLANRSEKENLNIWHGEAAKGAEAGSAAGPWGALIGGIAGSAKGMYNEIQARRDYNKRHGKKHGTLNAMKDTFTRFVPSEQESGSVMAAGSRLGGMYKGAKDKQKLQESGDRMDNETLRNYSNAIYRPNEQGAANYVPEKSGQEKADSVYGDTGFRTDERGRKRTQYYDDQYEPQY